MKFLAILFLYPIFLSAELDSVMKSKLLHKISETEGMMWHCEDSAHWFYFKGYLQAHIDLMNDLDRNDL